MLTGAGHEVLADPLVETDGLSLSEAVDAAAELAPELLVLDYVERDALSVKTMQQAREKAEFLKCIFVLAGEADRDHLIMAMNEGASALATSPVKETSFLNYVNRALSARRREMETAEEAERCRRLVDQERNCSLEQTAEIALLKRRLKNSDRLVNHLLATLGADRNHWTVLLVSDSAYQLDRFRKPLEDHNFTVTTAADGQAGLEKAQAERPRIIVSDLEMPGLNGLQLCKAVKNDASLNPNHFIIATADEGRINEIMRPENAVDDCLVKPKNPEDFQAFIARIGLGVLV
jgi:DNA-binding response OmpR family regulator